MVRIMPFFSCKCASTRIEMTVFGFFLFFYMYILYIAYTNTTVQCMCVCVFSWTLQCMSFIRLESYACHPIYLASSLLFYSFLFLSFFFIFSSFYFTGPILLVSINTKCIGLNQDIWNIFENSTFIHSMGKSLLKLSGNRWK